MVAAIIDMARCPREAGHEIKQWTPRRSLDRKVHDVTAPSPTLIFDLGNVLIRHDNELLYDRLAACCADPAAARPHLAAWLSDEDIGCGRLSIEALHARLAADHGFEETYAHFLELWSSHFSEEPGMEPVIRALARRHRVVLFSNTNAAHVEHIRANYQVFDHLHAAYLSHELGLVKPDADSFLKVLEMEGRPAEDCIFIDDRAENTAAAAALGMRTVTFAGRHACLAELDRYGVPLEF
ncbi:HAD-IA family hydrolase [Methylocapsa polymorpha]|uniref:HAD-IA family hydrolase n=1 Tax=Methylocapsa polymorpha TaxID=3080828 RepID=A0ABZ0HV31_9HYPH|nr:HAD-IA family hydrolase [Methylocapsa sp. RX1]